MPKSIFVRAVAGLCLLASVLLVGLVGWRLYGEGAFAPSESSAGTALVGGPFTLTDQFGQRRSDAEFRGKLMLVYFGYTYCPDVCPTELQAITTALNELGPAADAVVPIFITFDPARDTVEQMRAYAANFDPRLVALTGSEAEIAAVAKAYRVYYAKRPPDASSDAGDDYLMDHSAVVYLMDRDGGYLAHFTPGTPAKTYVETLREHLS
jgi:protein SCO1/2